MPPTWLVFALFVETGFLHVGQAGFELPTSGDPPALVSQSAGIIGLSHCAQPPFLIHKARMIMQALVTQSLEDTDCFKGIILIV